eukprot:6108585-Alexandrium_andersonii.AAC.1
MATTGCLGEALQLLESLPGSRRQLDLAPRGRPRVGHDPHVHVGARGQRVNGAASNGRNAPQ